jgi:hypothetical protein
VRTEHSGLGIKGIRIANLPPEVPEGLIRAALGQYGEIRSIQEETWSNAYRYPAANGIKLISIALKKHIPSYTIIASNRVLISYEGQPLTCYNCNTTDHVFQSCPKRLEKARGRKNEQAATWSQVAKHTNTAIHSSGHTATHVSNYNMIQGEGIQDVTNGSPNKEPEPNMEQPTLTNYEQGKEPQKTVTQT